MNQFKSLLWKEWLEIRVFFAIALFVFVGLPLIGGIEARYQTGHFEIIASAWTYFLGGVLAIFVGVGTVVRDLNGRLEDFWRSRPVSIGRWLIVKYIVGLVVVIFTLVVPLILELLINQTKTDLYTAPQLVLAWHPFLWAVLYSVGFLMACMVRRGAHAAMLSLAVMLLLYFLPEIIPPLRHLSVTWVVEESRMPRHDPNGVLMPNYFRAPWALGQVVFRPAQLQFVFGMIVLSLAAVGASLVVIRRDTRVESGRRTIYWSIGGAILILFTSASFQVASNLTLLQTIDMPNPHELAREVFVDGDHGLMLTDGYRAVAPDRTESFHSAHAFTITPAGVQLGRATILPRETWLYYALSRGDHPDVLYAPDYDDIPLSGEDLADHKNYPRLNVYSLNSPTAQVTQLSFKEFAGKDWGPPILYSSHDKLYYFGGRHVLTFDLTDPLKPSFISHRMFTSNALIDLWSNNSSEDADPIVFPLPDIPELSPRERLDAVSTKWRLCDGDEFYRVNENRLIVYHLDLLGAATATFRKTGRYDVTPVQRLFGSAASGAVAGGGFVYTTTSSNVGKGFRASVFDVQDPQRPHPVAHFALPTGHSESFPHRLPDGRILIASWDKLYVLSAPRK
ncbi:MAG TPA: ABC transporter permease [Tepidisphaeraceae bacterium]|jgi:hypothetical protein